MAFPQGLKPLDFAWFMYGLKPVPFKLKPLLDLHEESVGPSALWGLDWLPSPSPVGRAGIGRAVGADKAVNLAYDSVDFLRRFPFVRLYTRLPCICGRSWTLRSVPC